MPSTTAPAKAAGSGLAKVLLIIVGCFILLGAIGVGGIAYVAYRAKQRVERIGRDYGVDIGSRAAPERAASFPEPAGNGCAALPGQDVARVLGVPLERADSRAERDGTDVCEFTLSAAARKRIAGDEISTALKRMGSDETRQEKEALKEGERLISGAMNVLQNTAGGGDGPDIRLDIMRHGGREAWEKLQTAHDGVQSQVSLGIDSAGVGDKSYILPGGLHTFVLKDDVLFKLSFGRFAPAREKAIALASRVVAGL